MERVFEWVGKGRGGGGHPHIVSSVFNSGNWNVKCCRISRDCWFSFLAQRGRRHNVKTKLEEEERYVALWSSLCVYVLAAPAKSSQLKPSIDVRIMLLVETGILISCCATVGRSCVVSEGESSSAIVWWLSLWIALSGKPRLSLLPRPWPTSVSCRHLPSVLLMNGRKS